MIGPIWKLLNTLYESISAIGTIGACDFKAILKLPALKSHTLFLLLNRYPPSGKRIYFFPAATSFATWLIMVIPCLGLSFSRRLACTRSQNSRTSIVCDLRLSITKEHGDLWVYIIPSTSYLPWWFGYIIYPPCFGRFSMPVSTVLIFPVLFIR